MILIHNPSGRSLPSPKEWKRVTFWSWATSVLPILPLLLAVLCLTPRASAADHARLSVHIEFRQYVDSPTAHQQIALDYLQSIYRAQGLLPEISFVDPGTEVTSPEIKITSQFGQPIWFWSQSPARELNNNGVQHRSLGLTQTSLETNNFARPVEIESQLQHAILRGHVGHALHPQIISEDLRRVLREQQKTAIEKISRTLVDESPPSSSEILFTSPSGTGKTLVISEVLKRLAAQPNSPMGNLSPEEPRGDKTVFVVLASQVIVVDQIANEVSDWINPESHRLFHWGGLQGRTRLARLVDPLNEEETGSHVVVVSTVQSWLRSWNEARPEVKQEIKQRTRLLVIDEAHSLMAPTYKSYLKELRSLGTSTLAVTATPTEALKKFLPRAEHVRAFTPPQSETPSFVDWRPQGTENSSLDEEQVIPVHGGEVATQLAYAVQSGHLTPAEISILTPLHIHPSALKPPNIFVRQDGYTQINPEILDELADICAETFYNRKNLLIVTHNIREADRLVRIYSEKFPSLKFKAFHSKVPPRERKQILDEMKQGKQQLHLISVRMLDQGVDIPRLDGILVHGMPRNIFQIITRGVRLQEGQRLIPVRFIVDFTPDELDRMPETREKLKALIDSAPKLRGDMKSPPANPSQLDDEKKTRPPDFIADIEIGLSRTSDEPHFEFIKRAYLTGRDVVAAAEEATPGFIPYQDARQALGSLNLPSLRRYKHWLEARPELKEILPTVPAKAYPGSNFNPRDYLGLPPLYNDIEFFDVLSRNSIYTPNQYRQWLRQQNDNKLPTNIDSYLERENLALGDVFPMPRSYQKFMESPDPDHETFLALLNELSLSANHLESILNHSDKRHQSEYLGVLAGFGTEALQKYISQAKRDLDRRHQGRRNQTRKSEGAARDSESQDQKAVSASFPEHLHPLRGLIQTLEDMIHSDTIAANSVIDTLNEFARTGFWGDRSIADPDNFEDVFHFSSVELENLIYRFKNTASDVRLGPISNDPAKVYEVSQKSKSLSMNMTAGDKNIEFLQTLIAVLKDLETKGVFQSYGDFSESLHHYNVPNFTALQSHPLILRRGAKREVINRREIANLFPDENEDYVAAGLFVTPGLFPDLNVIQAIHEARTKPLPSWSYKTEALKLRLQNTQKLVQFYNIHNLFEYSLVHGQLSALDELRKDISLPQVRIIATLLGIPHGITPVRYYVKPEELATLISHNGIQNFLKFDPLKIQSTDFWASSLPDLDLIVRAIVKENISKLRADLKKSRILRAQINIGLLDDVGLSSKELNKEFRNYHSRFISNTFLDRLRTDTEYQYQYEQAMIGYLQEHWQQLKTDANFGIEHPSFVEVLSLSDFQLLMQKSLVKGYHVRPYFDLTLQAFGTFPRSPAPEETNPYRSRDRWAFERTYGDETLSLEDIQKIRKALTPPGKNFHLFKNISDLRMVKPTPVLGEDAYASLGLKRSEGHSFKHVGKKLLTNTQSEILLTPTFRQLFYEKVLSSESLFSHGTPLTVEELTKAQNIIILEILTLLDIRSKQDYLTYRKTWRKHLTVLTEMLRNPNPLTGIPDLTNSEKLYLIKTPPPDLRSLPPKFLSEIVEGYFFAISGETTNLEIHRALEYIAKNIPNNSMPLRPDLLPIFHGTNRSTGLDYFVMKRRQFFDPRIPRDIPVNRNTETLFKRYKEKYLPPENFDKNCESLMNP